MKITGYKAFNIDMTNQYGMKFEEGKTYTISGEVRKGTHGNGYHFAKNLEDSIHFIIDDKHDNVVVAKVTGKGNIQTFSTEDKEFDDLYVASSLTVDHIMTREEVIHHMLEKNVISAQHFIRKFPLNAEEQHSFKTKFSGDIGFQRAMAYYQEGDKEIYNRAYKSLVKSKK